MQFLLLPLFSSFITLFSLSLSLSLSFSFFLPFFVCFRFQPRLYYRGRVSRSRRREKVGERTKRAATPSSTHARSIGARSFSAFPQPVYLPIYISAGVSPLFFTVRFALFNSTRGKDSSLRRRLANVSRYAKPIELFLRRPFLKFSYKHAENVEENASLRIALVVLDEALAVG